MVSQMKVENILIVLESTLFHSTNFIQNIRFDINAMREA